MKNYLNDDFNKEKGLSTMLQDSLGLEKMNTINMAYTFRVWFEANVHVKDFLKKFKRKKEKEKENKILKSVRLHFNTNSKIIHNLTISLDDIKKKYNY